MNSNSTVQEWIDGFEKAIQEKFNKKIYLLAISNDIIRVDMDSIAKIVCATSAVSRDDLFSKNRSRQIVNARHVSMFLCYKYTSYSLKEIGKHFGGRDHTTVIHAMKTIKDRLSVQDELLTVVFTKSENIIKTLLYEEGSAK